MKRLVEINDSLPDLWAGVIIFGLLAELIPVWFVSDKLGYSIGIAIGVLVALFTAWHMAWSLDKALGFDEVYATKQMQKSSAIRYGVMLIVLGILIMTGMANPIAAFIGMIGLKVSAYLAPFTHKLFRR